MKKSGRFIQTEAQVPHADFNQLVASLQLAYVKATEEQPEADAES